MNLSWFLNSSQFWICFWMIVQTKVIMLRKNTKHKYWCLQYFHHFFIQVFILIEIHCCDKMMFIIHCNSSFFKNFKDAVCQILHSVRECEFIMHQYKIKGGGVTLWDHWVEYGCAQGKFNSVSYWGGDLKYKKRSSSVSLGWSSM